MSKIIIAIHGMGNKPPRKQLSVWWKAAIREGLSNKGKFLFLRFKMVYWASIVHRTPFNPQCIDKDDPSYLKEPYIKSSNAVLKNRDNKIKKRIRKHINDQLEKILYDEDGFSHFNSLTDFVLRHFVKDLAVYYGDPSEDSLSIRDEICRQLADILHKHKRKKILLIAHSMGSIIAWDVLTRYVPEVEIDTFVTIGSPLGIPVVKNHLVADLKASGDASKELRTPENIRGAWKNLADFKDLVAFNADLKNDFLPNRLGVQPEDFFIHNDYESNGNENHHKSYGYLRCPEMSQIISDFLKWKK
jgi:hypothetical protein